MIGGIILSESKELKEWENARKVMEKYDDRIHDLRKYGFSFITALLAAESTLLPIAANSAVKDKIIPDTTKLAVLTVTLLLILALRLMERDYKLFIKCAAERAKVIERNLNLELTLIISDRHQAKKISKGENRIYMLFVLGVFFLGATILFPKLEFIVFLGGCSLVSLYSIKKIYLFSIQHLYAERVNEKDQISDWTINQLECKRGDVIRIVLTNLHKENELTFEPGVVWEIKTQDGDIAYQKEIKNKLILQHEDIYIWELDTNKLGSGIYKFYPRSKKKNAIGKNLIIKE